jgi:hypothetical protein
MQLHILALRKQYQCSLVWSAEVRRTDSITFYNVPVADGGDDHQIWTVAANILNKQSQTADSGCASALGIGRGTNNFSPLRKPVYYEMLQEISDLDGFSNELWGFIKCSENLE